MNQLINKVEETLQGIKRYHIKMELDNRSGYVSDCDVDVEKEATHSIIQVGVKVPREVEFYWIGEEAYGLPQHVGTWFKVWVPGRPVSRLGAIFAILKTGEVTSVREEELEDERFSVFSVTPDLSALRKTPKKFVAHLLPSLEGSEKDRELLARLEKALREAKMQTVFWISQETYYIKKAIVTTIVSGAEMQMTYSISNINDPGLEVSPPAEALETEGSLMPLGALLIQLPDLGGWSEYNHCKITAEALKLIKKEDTYGKYSEIYQCQGKAIKPPYYSKIISKLFDFDECLFSWEEIPGNDSTRLKGFLESNYYLDWVNTAKIEKVEEKVIRITAGDKIVSLNLNNEKTEVNLKIDNGKNDTFIVKTENGKLNIYLDDKPLDGDAPVVQGAWAEDTADTERIEFVTDASYITVRTFRDHRHFGGQDEGLKWQDYFILRNTDKAKVEKPKNGVSYLSAKNWGYAGEDNDKMNFKGAIEAYNLCTGVGHKEAYYRMGHVLHLLQDQAEPDHAKLADHAASSMNEVKAYKQFLVCEVKMFHALEIGTAGCAIGCAGTFIFYPVCLGACEIAVGIAAILVSEGCQASIRSDEVGFEYLIKKNWDFNRLNDWQLKVKTEKSYDDYFKNMANDSIAAVYSILPSKDQKFPLGLGSLLVSWIASAITASKGASVKVYDTIPGLDPDIQIGKDDGPFLKLADAVIAMATNMSAGLLKHFYEIVNHPPYVERVVVVKAGPGLKPVKFAKFDASFYSEECAGAQVAYDAEWKIKNKTEREIFIDNKFSLLPDHEAYIFIIFGPSIGPLKSRVMDENTLKLNLHGMDPNNDYIDIPITLDHGYDDEMGDYYWGSFNPSNQWENKYSLTMEIYGRDASPHFSKRFPSGDEIASDPATIAQVNTEDSFYSFTNYIPGIDRNHKIEIDIGLPIESDTLEVNDNFETATHVKLVIAKTPMLGIVDDPTVKDLEYLKNLTLHTKTDIDFFQIEYVSDPKDDAYKGDFTIDIDGSGKNLKSFPAELQFYAKEKSGGCLTFDFYKSYHELYKHCPNTNSFCIIDPIKFFPEKNLFLAVTNPNFAMQGKLRYNLYIRYISSGLKMQGQWLYKFWELTRRPPPPERSFVDTLGNPIEVIWYRDYPRLIRDLEKFMPLFVEELGIEDKIERTIRKAEIQAAIGQIARETDLYDDAERLYLQSSKVFHQSRLIDKEANILRGLREIYSVRDRPEEVKAINRRLDRIR